MCLCESEVVRKSSRERAKGRIISFITYDVWKNIYDADVEQTRPHSRCLTLNAG